MMLTVLNGKQWFYWYFDILIARQNVTPHDPRYSNLPICFLS